MSPELEQVLKQELKDTEARRLVLLNLVKTLFGFGGPTRRKRRAKVLNGHAASNGHPAKTHSRKFNAGLYNATLSAIGVSQPVKTGEIAKVLKTAGQSTGSLYNHLLRGVKRGEIVKSAKGYRLSKSVKSKQ